MKNSRLRIPDIPVFATIFQAETGTTTMITKSEIIENIFIIPIVCSLCSGSISEYIAYLLKIPIIGFASLNPNNTAIFVVPAKVGIQSVLSIIPLDPRLQPGNAYTEALLQRAG